MSNELRALIVSQGVGILLARMPLLVKTFGTWPSYILLFLFCARVPLSAALIALLSRFFY